MNYIIENVPKKLESYQKNDKFVTSKTKTCYFISFIFFMKLILNFWLIVFISQVILSENLLNKKKMMQHRKRKKSHIEPKCHKVVLNSKAFAISSNLQI